MSAAAPTPTDRLLKDVLCTAIEGGIGYWSTAFNIQRDDAGDYISFELIDAEGQEDWKHAVTADTAAEGIRRILAGEAKARADLVSWIRNGVAEDDACDIDADAADVIIQVALFGEVVYG